MISLGKDLIKFMSGRAEEDNSSTAASDFAYSFLTICLLQVPKSVDVHHQISGGIFKGLLHRFYKMFTSHEEKHCEACEVTHKMSSMSLEELC